MRRGAVITQYFALLTKVIRSNSRNILKKRKISIVSTHYIYDGPGREGQRNNRREKEVYETREGTIFFRSYSRKTVMCCSVISAVS